MINGVKMFKGISIDKLKKYKLTEKDREDFPQLESGSSEEDSEEQSMIIEESEILVFASVIAEVESVLFYKIVDNQLITFTDILVYENINNFTLAFFNKLYIVIATDLNDILIYDPTIYNSLSPQILLSGHQKSVFSVLFFKNYIFSVDFSGQAFKWDFENRAILKQFSGNEPVYFNCNEDEIFFCEKNRLVILDENFNEILTLQYEKGNISCVAGNSKYLVIGDDDGHISIFNRENAEFICSKDDLHVDGITSLVIYNNNLYSGSFDGSVLVLSLELIINEVIKERNDNIPVLSICIYEDYCVIGGEGFEPFLKKLQ